MNSKPKGEVFMKKRAKQNRLKAVQLLLMAKIPKKSALRLVALGLGYTNGLHGTCLMIQYGWKIDLGDHCPVLCAQQQRLKRS